MMAAACGGVGSAQGGKVTAAFNFDLGKGIQGEGEEWFFQADEDIWWKVMWNKPEDQPPKPAPETYYYMYKWQRIIRGDGTTTQAFEDLKAKVTNPLPHSNCCTSWCTCWPACLNKAQKLEAMNGLNRMQLLRAPQPAFDAHTNNQLKCFAQAPAQQSIS